MQKEWYLFEYERKPYLRNKVLTWLTFPSKPDPNYHDHCELCWDRFSQHSADQHAGYYEHSEKIWICADCYDKYKELFGWSNKIIDSSSLDEKYHRVGE